MVVCLPSRPVTQASLYSFLDTIKVTHSTVAHPPLFTVADSMKLRRNTRGGHSKNLFLTDKKYNLILISALHQTQIALNQLHRYIHVGRLSFASPDLLFEALAVTPGSVTPFALLNDANRRVRFILDSALIEHNPIYFHPMVNTATTAVSNQGFIEFLTALGRKLEVFNFSTAL